MTVEVDRIVVKSKKNHGKQPLKTFKCEMCGKVFIYPARKMKYCHDCSVSIENARKKKRRANKKAMHSLHNIAQDAVKARAAGMSYGQARAAGVI